MLLAAGFVLRIKGGAVISFVPAFPMGGRHGLPPGPLHGHRQKKGRCAPETQPWHGYAKIGKRITNLEFLNVLLALVSAVIIVAYLMYTLSPETVIRLGIFRLYYTGIFVMAGIIAIFAGSIYLSADSGSPTKIAL